MGAADSYGRLSRHGHRNALDEVSRTVVRYGLESSSPGSTNACDVHTEIGAKQTGLASLRTRPSAAEIGPGENSGNWPSPSSKRLCPNFHRNEISLTGPLAACRTTLQQRVSDKLE